MDEKTDKRLTGSLTLLEEYGAGLTDVFKEGGQSEDYQAKMLLRGFDFGQKTIRFFQSVLESPDYDPLFGCMLCRPYYELSLRILWASRADYGWPRLVKYYDDEDKKWARAALSMPEFKVVAEKILDRSGKIQSLTDENGHCLDRAPNVETTLREIEEQNIPGGTSESESRFAPWEYNNIWRMLCRAVHAHISVVAQDELKVFVSLARLVPVIATRALLLALCQVAAADREAETEVINERVVAILEQ